MPTCVVVMDSKHRKKLSNCSKRHIRRVSNQLFKSVQSSDSESDKDADTHDTLFSNTLPGIPSTSSSSLTPTVSNLSTSSRTINSILYQTSDVLQDQSALVKISPDTSSHSSLSISITSSGDSDYSVDNDLDENDKATHCNNDEENYSRSQSDNCTDYNYYEMLKEDLCTWYFQHNSS